MDWLLLTAAMTCLGSHLTSPAIGDQIPLPQDDYYAFVARQQRRPLCEVYHWGARQPLPAVPIPLKAPDADIIVELQPVFAKAFARSRYERRLHYSAPPRARLSRADREWATQLAAAAYQASR